MKKLMLFISILLITIKSVCQQDFIEKAITNLKDEEIIKLVHNANLLKNNKEKYLEKLNKLLNENQFHKKTRFYKNKRYLKSLIFLGMGIVSVKPITFSVQNNDIKSGLIWGAIGSFLSVQGIVDLYKGLTNYDSKINYYRALAIREIFLTI